MCLAAAWNNMSKPGKRRKRERSGGQETRRKEKHTQGLYSFALCCISMACAGTRDTRPFPFLGVGGGNATSLNRPAPLAGSQRQRLLLAHLCVHVHPHACPPCPSSSSSSSSSPSPPPPRSRAFAPGHGATHPQPLATPRPTFHTRTRSVLLPAHGMARPPTHHPPHAGRPNPHRDEW